MYYIKTNFCYSIILKLISITHLSIENFPTSGSYLNNHLMCMQNFLSCLFTGLILFDIGSV